MFRGIIKATRLSWLSIFFMLGVLTSCSSHIAQPSKTWAKAERLPAEGCPDISGVYRNQGVDASDNKNKNIHQKYPEYLSEFIISGLLVNGRKHKWITHVELIGVQHGQLILKAKKQDKTIYTEVFKKDQDFTCTTKGIEITSSYTKVYDTGGAGKRSTTLTLRKSIDGSLIVKEQEKEAGLGLIILIPVPFSTQDIQYYKFPAMPDISSMDVMP